MSALVASIFLFVIISVFLAILGFKFWVQPKAALERVVGEVGVAAGTMCAIPAWVFATLFGESATLCPPTRRMSALCKSG